MQLKRSLGILTICCLMAGVTSSVVSCATVNSGYDLAKFDTSAINDINVNVIPTSLNQKEYRDAVQYQLAERIQAVLTNYGHTLIRNGDLSYTITKWPEKLSHTVNEITFEVDALPGSFNFKNFFTARATIHSVDTNSDISHFTEQWNPTDAFTYEGFAQRQLLSNNFYQQVESYTLIKDFALHLGQYLAHTYPLYHYRLDTNQIWQQRTNIFHWYYLSDDGVEHALDNNWNALELGVSGYGQLTVHVDGSSIVATGDSKTGPLSGSATVSAVSYKDLSALNLPTPRLEQWRVVVPVTDDLNQAINNIHSRAQNFVINQIINTFGGDTTQFNAQQLIFKVDLVDQNHLILPWKQLQLTAGATNLVAVTVTPNQAIKTKNAFCGQYSLFLPIVNGAQIMNNLVDGPLRYTPTAIANNNLNYIVADFKASSAFKQLLLKAQKIVPGIRDTDFQIQLYAKLNRRIPETVRITQTMLDNNNSNITRSPWEFKSCYFEITCPSFLGSLTTVNFMLNNFSVPKLVNLNTVMAHHSDSPAQVVNNAYSQDSITDLRNSILTQVNNLAVYQKLTLATLNDWLSSWTPNDFYVVNNALYSDQQCLNLIHNQDLQGINQVYMHIKFVKNWNFNLTNSDLYIKINVT